MTEETHEPTAPAATQPAEGEPVEEGEWVADAADGAPEADADADAVVEGEAISSPAKVMRIGSMVKQLLEEVRQAPLDDASRERLAEIYERSVTELSESLSPDLQEELRSLALPFSDGATPSDAELRVAQAQLVGWLEGLFHGIQATLFAQQIAAREQLQQIRQLPPGAEQGQQPQQSQQQMPPQSGGTYL